MFDVTTLLAIFVGGQLTLQVVCLVYAYIVYRRSMKLLAPRTQYDFGDIEACKPVNAGQCGNGACPCGDGCTCNHSDDDSDEDNLADYPEFTMKMNAAYTLHRFKRSGRVEFGLLQTAVESLVDALRQEIVDHDYVDTILDEITEVYEPPSKRMGRQFNKFLMCPADTPHNHSEWWNNVRQLVADNKTAEALTLVSAFNDELQTEVPNTCPSGNLIAEY